LIFEDSYFWISTCFLSVGQHLINHRRKPMGVQQHTIPPVRVAHCFNAKCRPTGESREGAVSVR